MTIEELLDLDDPGHLERMSDKELESYLGKYFCVTRPSESKKPVEGELFKQENSSNGQSKNSAASSRKYQLEQREKILREKAKKMGFDL